MTHNDVTLKHVKGIIFDLDGTLVTSKLDFQWMRQQVGCPENQDLLAYVDLLPSTQKARAHRIIYDHEIEEAQTSEALNGVDLVLAYCQQQRMPMAIVTRNTREAALIKVRKNNIPIDFVVTREDARPKPDPQALHLVADQWNIKPNALMYVGDYRYDILAANAAGMTSCFYCPGLLPAYHTQAEVVISDYERLVNMLKRSRADG